MFSFYHKENLINISIWQYGGKWHKHAMSVDINGEIHRYKKSAEQLCKQLLTVVYDKEGLNLKIRIGLKPRIVGQEYIESYSLWVNGTNFDKLPASQHNPYPNQAKLNAVVEANGTQILDGQMLWAHTAF